MKVLKCSFLVIALVFFGCQAQQPTEHLIQTTIPAPSLVNNLFDTPTEQPVLVYLPPSYNTSKSRYPVVYFLPGFTTDVTEMIDGTFQGLNIQTAMDSLIAAGNIREMIFVVANGRNFLGGSFYVNSPVTGNWEDFIVKDVVHFVDKKYRTLKNAASRGIAGSSMGGFGAINLGMLHPDVFSAVYSLSPGLFDEDGLTNQGMFVPEDKITQCLEKQETFDAMPEPEAKEAFKAFIAGLYGARSADGTFQGLNIQTVMDSLIAAGSIREMIFVVANGRNFLGGSFYVNSPVTGNWEDFIVKDVVHFVDKNYRTLKSAASRGIAGSSMGGFGAINLGMLHPDVFSAVYSLSPGLFDEDGLTNQGMFVPEDKITRYLEKQETFDAMPESKAKEAFKAFIAGLYDARSAVQYFFAFSYAYGAAFSPDPERGVPYINYPYTQSEEGLRLNREILLNYIRGFGGQNEKVRAHKENFLKLKGLTIDIGVNDYFQWIVQGSRHFARLLHETNIPHELVEHDGGHEDRLRERVESHLLPFFSEHLKIE